MTNIEEPAQLSLTQILNSRSQPQVTDPEGARARDDEDQEFKLPKTRSLVVVLVTNLFMQVMRTLAYLVDLIDMSATPVILFHCHTVIGPLRRKVGRRRHFFWCCHWDSISYLSLDPRPSIEVRQRFESPVQPSDVQF